MKFICVIDVEATALNNLFKVGDIVEPKCAWFNKTKSHQNISIMSKDGSELLDIPAAIFNACFQPYSSMQEITDRSIK